MHQTVPIPKELLAHGRSLEYKYVVHKADKKNDVYFEFIPKKKTHSDIPNRKLVIPGERFHARSKYHCEVI